LTRLQASRKQAARLQLLYQLKPGGNHIHWYTSTG